MGKNLLAYSLILLLSLIPLKVEAISCFAKTIQGIQDVATSLRFKLVPARSIEELEPKGNLISTPRLPAAVLERKNKQMIAMLNKLPKSQDGLNGKQIVGLQDTVRDHPVAGSRIIIQRKYDPEGKGICFAKAACAHIEGLKAGLNKDQIVKIWVVGRLGPFKMPMWKYHVATAVRGIDDNWYVIDPSLKGPLQLEEWYESMLKHYAIDSDIRLFATNPGRFTAEAPDGYRPDIMAVDPDLEKFFQDLRAGYQSNPELRADPDLAEFFGDGAR